MRQYLFIPALVLPLTAILLPAQQPVRKEPPCSSFKHRPPLERLQDEKLPRDCRAEAAEEIGYKLDITAVDVLLRYLDYDRDDPRLREMGFMIAGGKRNGLGRYAAAYALRFMAYRVDQKLIVDRLRQALIADPLSPIAIENASFVLMEIFSKVGSPDWRAGDHGDPGAAIRILVEAAQETQLPNRRAALMDRAKFLASQCKLEKRLDCTAALQGI